MHHKPVDISYVLHAYSFVASRFTYINSKYNLPQSPKLFNTLEWPHIWSQSRWLVSTRFYQIEGEKISGSMPIGMKMSPEEVFWVYFLGETWGNQIPRQMLYCIYCWWTKSCTTKDDDYRIIYGVLTIPGGAGFCPSTVRLLGGILEGVTSFRPRREKTPKNQWHTHVLNSWNWPSLNIDMIPDTPWKMPNSFFIFSVFFLHIYPCTYICISVYHLFQFICRYILVYILYIFIIFLIIFIHESFPCSPWPAMCFSCWGIGAGGLVRDHLWLKILPNTKPIPSMYLHVWHIHLHLVDVYGKL